MIRALLSQLVFAVHIFDTFASAELPPFGPDDTLSFHEAKYGIYPEVEFKTTDLHAPRPLLKTWGPQCRDSGEKVLIAPRGVHVNHPGPIMLDGNGRMVWHDMAFQDHVAYGATVQTYRNNPYLTFWTGSDKHRGIGQGFYYMFDQHYNQFKKIGASYNWTGDLHEFAITKDDTAVLTSYVPTVRDLTSLGGPKEGYIWDGIFQEVDIETNELLFNWKATDHFVYEDCFFPLPNKTKAGTAEEPWDWFHINSIDKDKHGNYLISSRYLHALVYIDGKTGDPLWILGGKHNDFEDLSDGNATNFAWQHHARWTDDETAITIFDNHVMSSNMSAAMDEEAPSRALKIKVNVEAKQVSVIWEIFHPESYTSVSQGSVQELDDGRRFVCYGSVSAWTEYDREGNILCDAEFGAMYGTGDHRFRPGSVMSYRGFKIDWVGRPYYVPKVLFENGIMYVSWNGATEVRKWSLQGTDSMDAQEHEWAYIGETDWLGFENQIEVGPYDYAMYRLIAHGTGNHHEGLWRVYSSGLVENIEIKEPVVSSQFTHNASWMLAGAVFAGLVIYLLQRSRTMNFGGGHWRVPLFGSNTMGRRSASMSSGYALVSRGRGNGQALFDVYQDDLRDILSDDDEEEIDDGVNIGPDVPVLKANGHSRKSTKD